MSDRKTWELRDADGRLVAFHVRTDNPDGSKDVRWRRPNGEWGLNGTPLADLPLYGAELVSELGEDELVVLAEGEKARDALEGAGLPAVGTVTGASGTPGPGALGVLRNRRVVLWPDADEAGGKHVDRIGEALRGIAAEVLLYTWDEAPEKGDAANHPAVKSRDSKAVDRLLTDLEGSPRFRPPAANREGADGEGRERRNQADRLIGYALEDLEDDALFIDQHGAPHALVDGLPVPLASRCYFWLRRLMWGREGKAVNGEYLKTAAGTLAAQAEFSGEVRELHTRAAWHEDALFYELRPGRVVRVDAEGWDIVDGAPVLFRRYPNLKPLPDPERGGDLKGLWAYLNLKTERDRRLLLAYVATVGLPHVPRPILNVAGAMGSGKSSLSRIVKRLLDPTAPETIRWDPRDFLQKAGHAYILMLDNLSTLPEQAADIACRLVTGEADSKRRLYSDDEDVIVELKRAILLNGINVPTDRGDVLDRSLVLELERIPDGMRRTEEELWEMFESEHPKLLGAVFDVLALAIAAKPALKLSRRPRLADWGEYAAGVYEVMGWGAERFLVDWDEVVKIQNQGTLDGSPVAQAVIKFMQEHDACTLTSSKMHAQLKAVAERQGVDVARDKAWPKSARWLWRRIKEVLPLLVAAGIEASRLEEEQGSVIALRKASISNASNHIREENPIDKPDTAGDTAPDDASSNASDDSNASPNASQNSAYLSGSGDTGDTGIRDGDFSEEGWDTL